MAVQVAKSKVGKVRASLGVRVKLRDGRVIDFGEVSTRPFLRHFQQFVQDYKLNKFRAERGMLPEKFKQLPVNAEEVGLLALYLGTALFLAWVLPHGVF